MINILYLTCTRYSWAIMSCPRSPCRCLGPLVAQLLRCVHLSALSAGNDPPHHLDLDKEKYPYYQDPVSNVEQLCQCEVTASLAPHIILTCLYFEATIYSMDHCTQTHFLVTEHIVNISIMLTLCIRAGFATLCVSQLIIVTGLCYLLSWLTAASICFAGWEPVQLWKHSYHEMASMSVPSK